MSDRITMLRQTMRLRAQRRAKKERVAFSTALFRVRTSEVLVCLSRSVGTRLSYKQISFLTGVPSVTVRDICERLRREGHELIEGQGGE